MLTKVVLCCRVQKYFPSFSFLNNVILNLSASHIISNRWRSARWDVLTLLWNGCPFANFHFKKEFLFPSAAGPPMQSNVTLLPVWTINELMLGSRVSFEEQSMKTKIFAFWLDLNFFFFFFTLTHTLSTEHCKDKIK